MTSVVSHRLPGGRSGKPAPILAKFVRREKRTEFMKKKRRLRETKRDVFIAEDLTSLRAKMLRKVKEDRDSIEKVWTIDGRIFCLLNGGTKVIIDTPDDLLKIGWSEERLRSSGLFLMG